MAPSWPHGPWKVAPRVQGRCHCLGDVSRRPGSAGRFEKVREGFSWSSVSGGRFRAPGRRKRVKTRDLPPGVSFPRVLPRILKLPGFRRQGLRLPGCHSARVLPRILTTPRVQRAGREATGVSCRTCFTEGFDIRGVPKAWLEATRVSFHACFTEDFDNSDANNLIFYVNLRLKKLMMRTGVYFRPMFLRRKRD